jgi:predicted DNA-binding transcriptional regulator AlpA
LQIYKQEAKMFEETAQNMRKIKALVGRLNVRQTALQAGVSRESVYSLLRDGPLAHWPTYRKLTAFLGKWESENGKLT